MNSGEMNLHPQAEAFLNWLISRSLQAGVLVLIVLVVQAVFRRQLTNRWRFALWWIPLLRLLLPVGPESAFSVFNFVKPSVSIAGSRYDMANLPATSPERAVQPPANDFSAAPMDADGGKAITPIEVGTTTVDGSQASAAGNGAGSVPGPRPPRLLLHEDFQDWVVPSGLILLWAAVAVVFGLVVATQSVRFRRRLSRSASPADLALVELLAECRRELQVKRRVELQETDAVASPALWGLLRLRILLPRGMAAKFTRLELRFIFLHELAHVKRGDLWLNWLLTVLQLMHWFNPLMWLGFARLRADRELACDELALVSAGETAGTAYGQTVIKLLEGLSRPRAVPGLIGILEDKKQMRRRISMLANFRRPGRKSALAVILLGLVAAVALTDAQRKSALPAIVTPITARGTASPGGAIVLPPPKPIPGATLKGRVILPDGTPADGADVALRLGPGYLGGPGGLRTTTGPDGRFAMPLYEAVQTIIAFSPEGIARVSLADLQASQKIQLQKWGRIEGTLMMGSHPGSNEVLYVGPAVGSPAFRLLYGGEQRNSDQQLHDFEDAQTDAQGRFAIDRIAPGEISISRMVSFGNGNSSGATVGIVEVKPGETTRVTLGGTGRALVGRLKLPKDETNGFTESHANLLPSAFEKRMVQMRNLKTQEERVAMSHTAEYEQEEREGRIFPTVISADGTFRLEDVPAGTYKFISWTEELAGHISHFSSDELIVPKAENQSDHTPIDFGTIEMKKTESLLPSTPQGVSGATTKGTALSTGSEMTALSSQWQPEPLGTVKLAGDLEVRLEKFVTHPYGQGHFHYDFLLDLAPSHTNETWVVEDAELSDAAGNSIATRQSDMYSSASTHPGVSGSVEGVLSPDQPALRLKVGLKLASGYPEAELITFSNLPLSVSWRTGTALTNFAFGSPIVLRNYPFTNSVVMAPGIMNGPYWAVAEPPDPKANLAVDIVNVVTDMGEKVGSDGLAWNQFRWNFGSVPPGTKYLKVTLAVQKERYVEFLAKPTLQQ